MGQQKKRKKDGRMGKKMGVRWIEKKRRDKARTKARKPEVRRCVLLEWGAFITLSSRESV